MKFKIQFYPWVVFVCLSLLFLQLVKVVKHIKSKGANQNPLSLGESSSNPSCDESLTRRYRYNNLRAVFVADYRGNVLDIFRQFAGTSVFLKKSVLFIITVPRREGKIMTTD